MQTLTTTTPPPDESLRLADDSGLVGPKVFGELVAREQGRVEMVGDDEVTKPYSSQSVINWVKQGRCTPAATNGRGRLFDPAHAAVVAQNIPTPTRGGARRNSGRKKTNGDAEKPPLTKRMKEVQDGHDAVRAFQDRIANDEPLPSGEAMKISETLGWTEDEFTKAMAVFSVGPDGLSPTMMGVLDKWMSIRERKQKFDKESGRLVEKDIIAETVARANGPVVEMLETLPRRLTERLEPTSWVSEKAVDMLIGGLYAALNAAGVDTEQSMVSTALDQIRETLTRPAALDSTIRAVISGEIDGAKRGLIKGIRGN